MNNEKGTLGCVLFIYEINEMIFEVSNPEAMEFR